MHDCRPIWQTIKRPLGSVLLCCALAGTLQGCFTLVAGGAIMGTLAATDRRTLGAQTEDKAIAIKGETRIPNLIGGAGHVNVTSFNRKVLLSGEVRDAQTKAAVEREIAAIPGVQGIFNELEIAGASSYTSRSNDTLITGKVKASFIDADDVYATAIKVVTENSVVYLMGRVTERESRRAAEVAAGVTGVRKVVKLFERIDEAELRNLASNSNPPRQ